jgi:hypothetical protein
MKTVDPSRRAIITGCSAAAVLGALATPAHAGQHDAEFRRLSGEYDDALADYRRVRAEFEPIEAEFHSNVQDCYGRLLVPMERFWELHKAMGVDDGAKRVNEASSKVDDITKRIRTLPTLSVYAIAIKLRILAFDVDMEDPTTDDLAEMDWSQECYVRLLREVEALAAAADASAQA